MSEEWLKRVEDFRKTLTTTREKTDKPRGWFSIISNKDVKWYVGPRCEVRAGPTFTHARCDRMPELSFWKHKIKRVYCWYVLKEIIRTRRRDWWNEGL